MKKDGPGLFSRMLPDGKLPDVLYPIASAGLVWFIIVMLQPGMNPLDRIVVAVAEAVAPQPVATKEIAVIEVTRALLPDAAEPWEYRLHLACAAHQVLRDGARAVGIDAVFSPTEPLEPKDAQTRDHLACLLGSDGRPCQRPENERIVLGSRSVPTVASLQERELPPDPRVAPGAARRAGLVEVFGLAQNWSLTQLQPFRGVVAAEDGIFTAVPAFSTMVWAAANGITDRTMLEPLINECNAGDCAGFLQNTWQGWEMPTYTQPMEALRLLSIAPENAFSLGHLRVVGQRDREGCPDFAVGFDPKGKYVLIGESIESGDAVPNPLSLRLVGALDLPLGGRLQPATLPGVYAHAYGLHNLLHGFPLADPILSAKQAFYGGAGFGLLWVGVLVTRLRGVQLAQMPVVSDIFPSVPGMSGTVFVTILIAGAADIALVALAQTSINAGSLVSGFGMGAAVVFLLAAASTVLDKDDRTLLARHLVHSDEAALNRLLARVGTSFQAAVVQFSWKAEGPWPEPAEVGLAIDRLLDDIRHACADQRQNGGVDLFFGNPARDGVSLIIAGGDTDVARALCERISARVTTAQRTASSPPLVLFVRFSIGDAMIVNVHDRLEEGNLLFTGPVFEQLGAQRMEEGA